MTFWSKTNFVSARKEMAKHKFTTEPTMEDMEGAFLAIRGWMSCRFPIGFDIDSLDRNCVINGVKAGTFQSVVGTCDRLVEWIRHSKQQVVQKKSNKKRK